MNRLLSRSLLWSVQAVLHTCTITVIASNNSSESVECHTWQLSHESLCQTGHGQHAIKKNVEHGSENTLFISSRTYIKRLIREPKELRDQLILEFPLWQGLRTHEVGTLRAEWVDIPNGILNVLDSKKHRLLPLPMCTIIAKHSLQYEIETGITQGIFLRELKGAKHVGVEGLCNQRILRICWHWCDVCHIPRMSPRDLRAAFAAWRHMGKHPMNIQHEKTMLRHTNVSITFEYINQLDDTELLREDYEQSVEPDIAEFYGGDEELSPFLSQHIFSDECALKNSCLGYQQGCHCRMFKPMEVKT